MHRHHRQPLFRPGPGAAMLLALASCLTGCQMRGDVRPLSSDIVPPPVLVDVPSECRDASGRIVAARC